MTAYAAAELAALVRSVRTPDRANAAEVRARIDRLTKPRGSLGRLEDLAVQLAQVYGDPPPALDQRVVVVMVADHGVSRNGVSAYPRAVTAQMCANFAAGGAAICAMAPAVGARVHVVDVGVDADVSALSEIVHHKVRRGTRDLSAERALTLTEVRSAILTGARVVRALDPLPDIMAIGEMGIGNTTAASALTSALTGVDAAAIVGRGTGISDEVLAQKTALVRDAVRRIPRSAGVLRVLGEVGGLEIGAMVGAILAAAASSRVVVIDGFVATAAALACAHLTEHVHAYVVPSHLSPEPGHRVQLEALGLRPYFDLQMRLGEGTGALLMLPLADAAGRMLRMATFESAGVATRATSGEQ